MKVIDPDFRALVASSVRAEMARRSLHQGDLAAALGLPRTGVSRRLTGHTPFTVDELHALAVMMDIPVARFLESACFPDSPEPDIDPVGARLRHPTGLASLHAEADRARGEGASRPGANPPQGDGWEAVEQREGCHDDSNSSNVGGRVAAGMAAVPPR